jgi:hypothetical protein
MVTSTGAITVDPPLDGALQGFRHARLSIRACHAAVDSQHVAGDVAARPTPKRRQRRPSSASPRPRIGSISFRRRPAQSTDVGIDESGAMAFTVMLRAATAGAS